MDGIGMAIWFAAGLALVMKGGDLFVDAAAWMAEALGIPKFVVGATVVSVATTLPELLVSLIAAAGGGVDMAVGNAVGSVTCNTGLILGILAAASAGRAPRREFGVKGALLLAAALVLACAGFAGALRRPSSLLLAALFALYIAENLISGWLRRERAAGARPAVGRRALGRNALRFGLGAAGIVAGARLMVDGGSAVAARLGVPESIVGVTMLAVGTSLPELATALAAIRRSQAQLSAGNLFGANIIDLTIILPLCALASGRDLPFSAQTVCRDMPACAALTALAVIPTLLTQQLSRRQGALLLGGYAAYLALLAGMAM